MKLRCPKCLYEYDFREASKDAALLAVIRMQADFGPHARLAFEYTELFNTTRPVKAARLLRVLSEVRDIYMRGEFSFQKSVYTISREGMAAALKVVCGKNFSSPLVNHSYLKKVMVSVAEEEAERRGVEAEKVLMEKEARLRAGVRPPAPSVIAGPFASLRAGTAKSPAAPARLGDLLPGRREHECKKETHRHD